MRGFGLDLSGNESTKVGKLSKRGNLAIDYDLRDGSQTFTVRCFRDMLPWSKGLAYDDPRFSLEDLADLQLLLAELTLKVGKLPGPTFEHRLNTGHYDSLDRRRTFIADALKELGLPGDHRAHDMLKLALMQSDGSVRRAWPLLKSMVKAADLRPLDEAPTS